MAARKRKRPARAAKAEASHEGAATDHGRVIVTVTIGPIGPLKRIRSRKARRGGKSTPKEVKAFLEWALTQL